MTDIGANIQVYRKRKNMTQHQLSEKMHVSRQTISKWELNKSTPTIEYLIQLSQEFEVTLDQLVLYQSNTAKNQEDKLMKKALLLVQYYTASNDTTWGNEAQDYGTRDLLANLSQEYPQFEWRAIRFHELDDILSKITINLIVVTPAVARFLNSLKENYTGDIRVLTSVEYAQMTLNHILDR